MMILENFTPHATYTVCATCPKIEIAIAGFFLGVITCLFLGQVYRVLWKEEIER
jgi:hypothetical protein